MTRRDEFLMAFGTRFCFSTALHVRGRRRAWEHIVSERTQNVQKQYKYGAVKFDANGHDFDVKNCY